MVGSRLLLHALVATLVVAPLVNAHGANTERVHLDQDAAITAWLATLQLASPAEAEQLVAEPVPDIEVSMGIVRIVVPEGEDDVPHSQEFRPMLDRGDGTFHTTYDFVVPADYRVGFNVVTTEGDDLGTKHLHILVEEEESSGIPALQVPVVLATLVGAALLLRRR